MNLNDMLASKGIDPKTVIVMRHRPWEPQLKKVLPWLAAEHPKVYNAYQQTQGEKVEKVMQSLVGVGYVASFIGQEPGKALFVGLYSIDKSKKLTHTQYWKVPENKELKAHGMDGFNDRTRSFIRWFDLSLKDFYASWRGKLMVSWSSERAWWRRAHRNEIPVVAVLEDNALDMGMPEWDAIELTWKDLSVMPARYKAALAQWRGIYYIYDISCKKGYVGSAYGKDNLFGRWLDYAKRGHGGNRLLKKRNPDNFMFSILQRVSPDMVQADVVKIENSWKQRLHARYPFGLNDN